MTPGVIVSGERLDRLRHRLNRWRRRPWLIACTRAAQAWRHVLWRTTVIAITGSLGKTTTRELLHAVLSETGRGSRTALNSNGDRGVVRALLAARPWHRHCIIEIGVEKPGDMARNAHLVRPDMGVFLNVGRCHLKGFGTLENVLTEKLVLFQSVRRGGTAVLNVADPTVRTAILPDHLRCVTFAGWRGDDEAGANETPTTTPSAASASSSAISLAGPLTAPACRLVSATSVWPDSLTLEIEQSDGPGKPAYRVRYVTRLHGEHWANAVVATVATARTLGVSNHNIASGLSRVPNWSRRLEPIPLTSRQATFVRDEYNGSIETYRASLAWLAKARAGRRIIVYGDAADMRASYGPRLRLRDLTRMAANSADHLAPITPYPDKAIKTGLTCGLETEQVTPLGTVHEAITWCRSSLRHGDLLLCKGRMNRKLERVYLGLFAEVACRRETCALKRDCKDCPELGFEVTPSMLAGTAEVLAPTRDRSMGDMSTKSRDPCQ